jgi:hypothetical protein
MEWLGGSMAVEGKASTITDEEGEAMARPPKKTRLIDGLDGSAQAKERLEIILKSIAGEISALEAQQLLDVSESRFHQLREEALKGALAQLEPSRMGRPPKPDTETEEVKNLRLKNESLIHQLKLERTMSKITAVLAADDGKKNKGDREKKRRRSKKKKTR